MCRSLASKPANLHPDITIPPYPTFSFIQPYSLILPLYPISSLIQYFPIIQPSLSSNLPPLPSTNFLSQPNFPSFNPPSIPTILTNTQPPQTFTPIQLSPLIPPSPIVQSSPLTPIKTLHIPSDPATNI